MVRAGRNGEDEEFALEHNVAVIGFRDYPSLAKAADYEGVQTLVQKATPELRPGAAGNFAGQLRTFALSMQVGDIVVLPRKLTAQVALGLVKGPYRYQMMEGEYRHVREVEWVRPDVARSVFGQDLLYSFGAFMTVCQIRRNGAEERIAAVLSGESDPGYADDTGKTITPQGEEGELTEAVADLGEAAHDEIVAHIQSRFSGHDLARLVEAVLRAEGWVTRLSPPGPDGGVDILAGRGSLGLDQPRLCVQVKSSTTPADVTVYRTLQGSMQSFKAEQGLLVSWGGFNKVVLAEARQGYFAVRLWESRDLVEAIYRNYERLPAEVQAELPLKRVWMLVKETPEG